MFPQSSTIYTIGHGRHAFSDFLELLRENGIGYEHLPECGGKVVAPQEDLARGIERILELAAEMRIVLMCSESQPLTQHKIPRAHCHRVGLLAPPLTARGATMIHILPNGRTISFDESAVPSLW